MWAGVIEGKREREREFGNKVCMQFAPTPIPYVRTPVCSYICQPSIKGAGAGKLLGRALGSTLRSMMAI